VKYFRVLDARSFRVSRSKILIIGKFQGINIGIYGRLAVLISR